MLHQLGAGALGPVFRAFDPDRDRLVAIKLFKLDITPEQSLELSRTLGALGERLGQRPGIATLLSAGVEGTTAYLVEQYVPADGLDTRLRRRTGFGVPAAVPLVRQVADILDAAAAVGVRHGALHPRDILVSTTDEVTITGLGVADAVEAAGGRVPVRRPYAAPERVAERIWDRRADVYSLGVIAFELMTGRRPVADSAPADEEADAFQRVLARALAERPDDRFATAGDLADALDEAAAGRSVGPARGTPAPELPLFETTSGSPEPVVADEPTIVHEPAAVAVPVELDEVAVDEAAVVDEFEAAEPEMPAEPPFAEQPLRVWEPELPPASEPEPPPASEPERVRASAPEPELKREPESEPARPSPVERPAARYRPYEWPDQQPAPAPAPSRRYLATAVTLAAGMALGLAGGYFIWGNARTAPDIAVRETEPTMAMPPPSQPAAAETQLAQPVPLPAPPRDEPSTPAPPATGPGSTKPADTRATAPREPGRSPEPVRGRLLVRSSPSGARVTVDGRVRGVTPLELRDVALGSHTLVISREGHLTATRRVTLRSRQPSQSVEVTLSRAPSPAASSGQTSLGAIDIFVRPSGARVSVDGRYLGVAPLRVPELAPGSYVVTLELEGHRRWSATVQVAAGQVARVSASLEPDPPR